MCWYWKVPHDSSNHRNKHCLVTLKLIYVCQHNWQKKGKWYFRNITVSHVMLVDIITTTHLFSARHLPHRNRWALFCHKECIFPWPSAWQSVALQCRQVRHILLLSSWSTVKNTTFLLISGWVYTAKCVHKPCLLSGFLHSRQGWSK